MIIGSWGFWRCENWNFGLCGGLAIWKSAFTDMACTYRCVGLCVGLKTHNKSSLVSHRLLCVKELTELLGF
jgi:hypothetical protein